MIHRPERMAESLREVVTEIVGYELEDPRLQSVAVTEVRVSDNLRDANVYVLVEGEEERINESMHALKHASTFVRQQVALNLNLRHAPHIHFVRDTVEENASKIEGILEELSVEEDFEREI